MLPNTLQGTGQLPRAKNHLTKTVAMSLPRNQDLAQQTLPRILLLSQAVNVINGWCSSTAYCLQLPQAEGTERQDSDYMLEP